MGVGASYDRLAELLASGEQLAKGKEAGTS